MEVEFNPQADRLSASCLNAGMCDYDIYPLPSRFYMDQVPLDLFQFGKVSLNPNGAGFCWITGADKKSFFFTVCYVLSFKIFEEKIDS